MKTLFFLVLVTGAGVYLASQNETGIAWVDDFFSQHDIQQSADELVNEVETRIQQLSEARDAEQQNTIKELRQRITELEQEMAELNAREQNAFDDIPTFVAPRDVQGVEIQPPVEVAERREGASINDKQVKQANLRDISERMQALSFGSALGNN